MSTIWAEYTEIGSSVLNEKKLNFMIIDTESSNIISTHLYGYIIVFRATTNSNIATMKNYIECLSKVLYEKFSVFEDLITDKYEENNDI